MAGAVFFDTLKRNWRTGLYWGIFLAILGFYILVVIPDVDALKQYASMMEVLPPAMLQFFGMSDTSAIGTPEGFIAFGYFGYILLILAVYAVISGLNVTANEEDEGIMDVLLSLPLKRWRIIIEKFSAYTLLTIGIIACGFLGLFIGMQTSAIKVDTGKLIVGSINVIPSTMLMIAFTMFIATVVRRKAVAAGMAAAFVVASYFVDMLGMMASGTVAESLSVLSFFHYYDNQGAITNGLNGVNIVVLLVAIAAMLAGSLWFFERRDVGI